MATAVNMNNTERIASGIAGALLALLGLRRKGTLGGVLAGLGGALVVRGARGVCPAYSVLGFSTVGRGIRRGPERFIKTITIDKPVEEVYRFWRNLSNLTRVIPGLESVRETGGNRSHWVLRGPSGWRMEWDAMIEREIPNELIEWRSEGGGIPRAGMIRFRRVRRGLAGHPATEVRVEIAYETPGGAAGKWLATAFGHEPGRLMDESLRGIKQRIEAGSYGASPVAY